MNISIKYFAGMRDRMGCAEASVSLDGECASVADVWAKASNGQPLPDSTLIAVNMEYTDADAQVTEGDEVAFFPPVTGG